MSLASYPGLIRVLNNWSMAVRRPRRSDSTGFLREENPELARVLDSPQASLPKITAMGMRLFDPIGSDITWLSTDALIWLLPIVLAVACISQEPVFATSIVNAMLERLPKSEQWREITRKLTPQTRRWIREQARLCCELGWDDPKRRKKREMAIETSLKID